MSGLETPRGRQLAVNALATWQNHHGELSEEQTAVFITRRELRLLVNVSDEVLSDAISKHRRIIEFVPYALACQLEILRHQVGEREERTGHAETSTESLARDLEYARRKLANAESQLSDSRERIRGLEDELKYWRDSSIAESHSGRPEPGATKSKLNRPQGSKPANQSPKQSSNKKRQEPNTSTAGVSHLASGFSGKPRQMKPEFDDTERCSQCGARISASAAALHECHY